MFAFGRKKTEEMPKKKELLELGNIRLNCKGMPKEDVIKEVGSILADSGYVDESYTDAMIKRELTFPTNIGNGIALPHGVEEAKKDIRHSGIAVMVFPDGTGWGNEDVKLVIGIAGAGEEHLEILSIIAEKMSDPKTVDLMVKSSAQDIYKTFTQR